MPFPASYVGWGWEPCSDCPSPMVCRDTQNCNLAQQRKEGEVDWNNPRIDIRDLPLRIQSNLYNRKLPDTLCFHDANQAQLDECRKKHNLNRMTPREVLSEWLAWEGIIGYDGYLSNLVESIIP